MIRSRFTSTIAAVIGLVLAILAGLVALRAGVATSAIVQTQVVGIAYLIAGVVAWFRRPDNATGPLLMAISYSWYIPEFQAAPLPVVAGLAFATRRLVNTLSAYLLLAFPSGRLGPQRHRIAMGLVIAIAAIQMPTRLLLTDRIPAELGQVDRVTTPGCDCANPFGVVPAPDLLASIEQ